MVASPKQEELMKVWFSIIPGHGHFFPLLPLARALGEAGHDVAFGTSASYGETIRRHGFEAFEVGLDYTQGSAMGEGDDPGAPVEQLMFVDGPPAILDSYLSLFEHERPDVMVFDPIEMGGMVAAEAAEIPYAAAMNALRTGVLPGRLPFDIDERFQFIQAHITGPERALREKAGLAPDTDRLLVESMYDRTLILNMAPPSLDAWPLDWKSHTAHPLRPEVHMSDDDGAWLESIPTDRRVISVSLGTLFGTPELYRTAVEAALATGHYVVAATSFDFGIDHPSLKILDWVSMDRLMEVTDLFVHHGGWGSTVAAMASGTPSVLIPLGAEQPIQAVRLAATGAGTWIPGDKIADDLQPAIEAVLDNDVYRLNAQRLQKEIAEMPPAAEVVPLLERLASDGAPILNR